MRPVRREYWPRTVLKSPAMNPVVEEVGCLEAACGVEGGAFLHCVQEDAVARGAHEEGDAGAAVRDGELIEAAALWSCGASARDRLPEAESRVARAGFHARDAACGLLRVHALGVRVLDG